MVGEVFGTVASPCPLAGRWRLAAVGVGLAPVCPPARARSAVGVVLALGSGPAWLVPAVAVDSMGVGPASDHSRRPRQRDASLPQTQAARRQTLLRCAPADR